MTFAIKRFDGLSEESKGPGALPGESLQIRRDPEIGDEKKTFSLSFNVLMLCTWGGRARNFQTCPFVATCIFGSSDRCFSKRIW